ncbi:MAG: DegT/DnrJ/EryC1/StrS family aminotransferase [Spirochaetes bacterium]|nr:DegT/DnrJ/EryC1/StrS family aminotransferase [Spirochaetota bacterium]
MPGPGSFLIGEEERRHVAEVMETGYLSRYGSETDPRFKRKVVTLERLFAERSGVRHALAVNGGTGAIMASLVALGVGPGVEVLVPGYTFVASISAVLAVGGIPILAEMDESLTMDPGDLEGKITGRTRVIMPVHMLGNPSAMDAINAVARRHKLLVLEDCCQALGATYRGKAIGTYGDIGAFSLNINKTITSGDGGIIITDDTGIYERAFAYHDQGHKPLRMGLEIGKRSILGINLRMNELSGAFALGQLEKLDRILSMLKDRKARFKNALSEARIPGMKFRVLNDPGECATLLVVIFDDPGRAARVAKEVGSKTVAESGWHVYNHMEQILAVTDEKGKPRYHKGMLPRTDDILSRSIALSVGVVDAGLGAGFGINVLSNDVELRAAADRFIRAARAGSNP